MFETPSRPSSLQAITKHQVELLEDAGREPEEQVKPSREVVDSKMCDRSWSRRVCVDL